jgi:indole-3-glycerol phosphate synthase
MYALIELYEASNLAAVLETGTSIIGVNNRDLHTFQVDLHHTVHMRELIPSERCLVGESGIANADDARMLFEHGVQAILVGESLVKQPDIEAATKALLR